MCIYIFKSWLASYQLEHLFIGYELMTYRYGQDFHACAILFLSLLLRQRVIALTFMCIVFLFERFLAVTLLITPVLNISNLSSLNGGKLVQVFHISRKMSCPPYSHRSDIRVLKLKQVLTK